MKVACIALFLAAQAAMAVTLPAFAQSSSSGTATTPATKPTASSNTSTVTVVQDERPMPNGAKQGYNQYDPRAFIPRQQQPGNTQSTNTVNSRGLLHQGYNHLDNGYMYLGGANRGTDKDPRLNANNQASPNQATQDPSQATAQPGVTQTYDSTYSGAGTSNIKF